MHRLANLSGDVVEGRFGSIPFSLDLGELHTKRLSFWLKELQECVEEKRRVSVSVAEAREWYRRADRGVFPLGLGRVLVELERSKKATRLEQFGAKPSLLNTLTSVVLSPLRWAMAEQVAQEPNVDQVFVLDHLVEQAGLRVLSELQDACFSKEDAMASVKKIVDGDRDVEIVLDWLMGKAGLVEPFMDGSLVKRVDASVTELDVSIYELRKAVRRLQLQEEDLSNRIRSLREHAKEAITVDRNKVKALALLRRKKVLEDALAKRLEMGTNVTLVLSRVEEIQATNDAVGALRLGTEALKANKVQVDQVQDLLDEFAELQAEQNRVDEVISEAAKSDFDMDELEMELEGLKLLDEPVLPSVPIRVPVAKEATAARKTLVLE